MLNDLIAHLRGKNILILGFGREGKSSYQFIRKHLPDQPLTIADQRPDFWENPEPNPVDVNPAQDPHVTLISGPNYLQNLETYDLVLKTPGISFAKLDTSKIHIGSQLELLLEFFPNPTIGITGTKGKSTTSTLIYEIIKAQKSPVLLLGNIGTPVFDYLDQITADTTLVLEMSSHQLEFMRRSPQIAVLLNAYEEHLDHYNSFSDYVKAKCQIYQHQTPNDSFFYNLDNATLRETIHSAPGKLYKVSLEHRDGSNLYRNSDYLCFNEEIIYDCRSVRHLPGDYNLENILFALGVAKVLNLDLKQAAQTVQDFRPLKHRLEFVGEYQGIKFYDNSIGTIPAATIAAIEALGDVDSLIIGGLDRGLDYSDFSKYLSDSSISHIICMPTTGHQIAQQLPTERVHLVNTLEEAVKVAKVVTTPGKSCLLSPAAASYNDFKNFEEKGDLFQKLVRE